MSLIYRDIIPNKTFVKFNTPHKNNFINQFQKQLNSNINTNKNRQIRRSIQTRAKSGLGDEDVDVAVFRFTLGIPGFEDRLIPRVIGSIGIILLTINHLISGNIHGAQTRTEVIVSILAIICIFSPSLEQQLLELQPGKGRKEAAEQVVGSINAFAIDDTLKNKQKQELAWASFALLKNTNSCSVFVIGENNKVLMLRGALKNVFSGQKGQEMLKAVEQSLQLPTKSSQQSQYLQDRSSISSSWLEISNMIAAGIQCGVVESLQKGGFLVVLSERNRAFQERDRKWIAVARLWV
eukprot:TRINITY_DN27311_c0_g1_i2.p1 TRINITY_DN27311_c0_g1~~TRINITY_DN27311_c0_g1_i2.p1  ORF type:complete len:294 (+),score=36.05 TRINITY_DN27311_c0_g1_i2:1406-2287(+)